MEVWEAIFVHHLTFVKDFRQMAENYALTFNKASSKTIVDIAADDAAMIHVDISNDSPKTAKLKTIGHQLNNLKADIDSQDQKTMEMDVKYGGIGTSIQNAIADMQEDMVQMGQDAEKKHNEAKTSLSAIATDMVEIKKMVSFMLRQGN